MGHTFIGKNSVDLLDIPVKQDGDWGGTTNGYPMQGGGKATGTEGWPKEVTTVELGNSPAIGAQTTVPSNFTTSDSNRVKLKPGK